MRVTSPSRTSLPPRPAIRSSPPPPKSVLSRALPMIVSSYGLPRTLEIPIGSESVSVARRESRSAVRSGRGRSKCPSGALEKSSVAILVPSGSTTVWLPLEPPLKAKVSLPPPPTSESSPAPPTSVSSLLDADQGVVAGAAQ